MDFSFCWTLYILFLVWGIGLLHHSFHFSMKTRCSNQKDSTLKGIFFGLGEMWIFKDINQWLNTDWGRILTSVYHEVRQISSKTRNCSSLEEICLSPPRLLFQVKIPNFVGMSIRLRPSMVEWKTLESLSSFRMHPLFSLRFITMLKAPTKILKGKLMESRSLDMLYNILIHSTVLCGA